MVPVSLCRYFSICVCVCFQEKFLQFSWQHFFRNGLLSSFSDWDESDGPKAPICLCTQVLWFLAFNYYIKLVLTLTVSNRKTTIFHEASKALGCKRRPFHFLRTLPRSMWDSETVLHVGNVGYSEVGDLFCKKLISC